MNLCLGLTMFRQSRSPRSMPSTSISAVATLEAKGMLFWSHSREMYSSSFYREGSLGSTKNSTMSISL